VRAAGSELAAAAAAALDRRLLEPRRQVGRQGPGPSYQTIRVALTTREGAGRRGQVRADLFHVSRHVSRRRLLRGRRALRAEAEGVGEAARAASPAGVGAVGASVGHLLGRGDVVREIWAPLQGKSVRKYGCFC
jgi:hypothetical protein